MPRRSAISARLAPLASASWMAALRSKAVSAAFSAAISSRNSSRTDSSGRVVPAWMLAARSTCQPKGVSTGAETPPRARVKPASVSAGSGNPARSTMPRSLNWPAAASAWAVMAAVSAPPAQAAARATAAAWLGTSTCCVAILDLALAHLHLRHQQGGVHQGEADLAEFRRREAVGIVLMKTFELGGAGRLRLGRIGDAQLDKVHAAGFELPAQQPFGQQGGGHRAGAHRIGQLLPRQVGAQQAEEAGLGEVVAQQKIIKNQPGEAAVGALEARNGENIVAHRAIGHHHAHAGDFARQNAVGHQGVHRLLGEGGANPGIRLEAAFRGAVDALQFAAQRL